MQRLEKILEQKSGSKSSLKAKLFQYLQRNPKHEFSEKVQSGDQRKFFKNRPKNNPRLKGPKALAQNPLTSNLYALQVKRLEKILAQKSSSKTALMPKLLQFLQGHPKPSFSEKVQKEDQGKFFKNSPKVAFV